MRRLHVPVCFCAVLLLVGAGLPVRAQFVSGFGVTKTGYYIQTNDSTPELDSFDDPFEFYVYVMDSGLSVIDSAVVTVPSVPPQQIDLLAQGLFGVQYFPSQTALDQAFRNGAYTFQITDEDFDILYETLNLAGNAYPTIPQLLNYASLQSINTNTDLTLQWLPFQGGTAGDKIDVDIEDDNGSVFTSEVDGTVTSVVVPAGTLMGGTTNDVFLRFKKVVDVNSNSAPGEAAYARSTYATIKTSSGGATTVTIGSYALVPNGPFQVQVSESPGSTLALEATTDFVTWAQVDTITPVGGTGTLSDANVASSPRRFYRVKAT
jgi:hypothetical protein